MAEFKNGNLAITGPCIQFETLLGEFHPINWSSMQVVVGYLFPGAAGFLENGHFVPKASNTDQVSVLGIGPGYAPDWPLITTFAL